MTSALFSIAEESVVGACILSRGAREEALRTLTPADFHSPRFGAIFDAIAQLHRAGEPIDTVSVVGAAGGDISKSEVLTIQANTTSAANVGVHIRSVLDAATRRRIVAHFSDLLNAAQNQADTGDLLERAKAGLEEIQVPLTAPDETVDFDAVADREVDLEWLVPGLYARGDRLVVVAPPGKGKTTFLRQHAVLLSQGIFPIPGASEEWEIKPLNVLHVDCENPAYSSTYEYRKFRTAVRGVKGIQYDPSRLRIWEKPEGLDITRRSDVVRLAGQIEHASPDVVCAGPLYKMVSADMQEQTAVSQLLRTLDELRARFGFVLILEGHQPHDATRPFGSANWTWWPEFGVSLSEDGDDENRFELKRFRGDRHPTSLPRFIRRGGTWPWEASR